MDRSKIATAWEQHCATGWPQFSSPHQGQLMTIDTVISGCVVFYLDSAEGLEISMNWRKHWTANLKSTLLGFVNSARCCWTISHGHEARILPPPDESLSSGCSWVLFLAGPRALGYNAPYAFLDSTGSPILINHDHIQKKRQTP
jgi:hypothetical protein